MALYLSEHPQEYLLAWAARRADVGMRWPDGAHALAVIDEDGGRVRAVMVTVQTYSRVIDMHFASDGARRWATRAILAGIFGYLFIYRRARRVQTCNSVKATHLSDMLQRLGFKRESVLRDAIAVGEDGAMFSMLPHECRWIQANEKKDIAHGPR